MDKTRSDVSCLIMSVMFSIIKLNIVFFFQVEKKTMVPVDSGLNMNINTLLKKYNDGIIKATTGCDVDLSKIAIVLCENPIADHSSYNFTKEWPCQWIQSIYNAL